MCFVFRDRKRAEDSTTCPMFEVDKDKAVIKMAIRWVMNLLCGILDGRSLDTDLNHTPNIASAGTSILRE